MSLWESKLSESLERLGNDLARDIELGRPCDPSVLVTQILGAALVAAEQEISPEEKKALTDWAAETQKKNGWGPKFDAALAVARRLSRK